MSIRSVFRSIVTLGKGVVQGLPQATDDRDPIELFVEWFGDAAEAGILLPESVALATSTPEGRPSARMVLLKDVDETGFVFYTNFGSRKAQELDANPHAALLFHWVVLERQVRVEGRTERISEEEATAYFSTRTRGSAIGAWASRQSDTLPNPDELRERVSRFETEFKAEDEVPLPPFWGGYRLVPTSIEFWQGRANRLHDRLVFERSGDSWSHRRLYP